ncbi:Protoheme ferro-lyase [gamma proteobacterium HdN1]|nr:Protoheme ferro-lyase [gamma proteobacterium HdN1]
MVQAQPFTHEAAAPQSAAPFEVLLVNLGTPTEPSPPAIRRYLKAFLQDTRVVNTSRWLWWLVLNGFILPFRPKHVAKLYKSIWTDQGSPLLVHSQRLADQLSLTLRQQLGQTVPVHLAMTYGTPALAPVIQNIAKAHSTRPPALIVLPLFPQYSATTTGAAFDAIAREIGTIPNLPTLHFIRSYAEFDPYICALAHSIQSHWETHPRGEKLLFSFHGIPASYQQKGDPYPEECAATAHRVAEKLGLSNSDYALAFQSRFGRQEWVKPYTDHLLAEWGQQGIRSIDVICPGFAADCLETLEEITIRGTEQFHTSGGKTLNYIPCLNDQPTHAEALAQLTLRHTPHSSPHFKS